MRKTTKKDAFLLSAKSAATNGCRIANMSPTETEQYVGKAMQDSEIWWFIHKEKISTWPDKKDDVIKVLEIIEDANTAIHSIKIMGYFVGKYGDEKGLELTQIVHDKLLYLMC